MKKAVLLVAAAALAFAGPAALAEPKKPHPHGGPPGQMKKMWRKGERLPSSYYTSTRYYIVEPARYRLAPPPAGYRWVLVDGDAYLVRRDNGLVADLVANAVASLLR
jgi:Ni/Co efflux regulator RcnB